MPVDRTNGVRPPEDSPDQEALRQGGADVLLGEAGDQLADGQAVPSAQSMQQRHPVELHHAHARSQTPICCPKANLWCPRLAHEVSESIRHERWCFLVLPCGQVTLGRL